MFSSTVLHLNFCILCRGRVRVSDRFGSPTAGPDRGGVVGEVNHTVHRRGVGREVNLPPAADKKRGRGVGLMKKKLNEIVGGLFDYAPERDDRISHL